jgi:hypothetical protein
VAVSVRFRDKTFGVEEYLVLKFIYLWVELLRGRLLEGLLHTAKKKKTGQ